MTEIARSESAPAPRAEVIAVPFLGGHIPCFMDGDEPMVVLRPISDLLGISWPSQFAKATRNGWARHAVTRLPGDAQSRTVTVVSLEHFTLWLAGLQSSRLRCSARPAVKAFKEEAARALRAHFFDESSTAVHDRLAVVIRTARKTDAAEKRHVYFVQAATGGPVKIGSSVDVEGRLRQLQSASPQPLRIIGVIPNAGFEGEREMHAHFAADRQHGEWFRPSSALQNFLAWLPRPHLGRLRAIEGGA